MCYPRKSDNGVMATYNRIQRGCVLNATIMTMQTKRATCVQSDNGVLAACSRIQRGCVLNATIMTMQRKRATCVQSDNGVLATYNRIQRARGIQYIKKERERERDHTVDINSKVESL